MKVVFILLDCVRYDHFGCNGNEEIYTPTIDALSQKGCNFKKHFTVATWTAPSVSAIVTGIYPHRIKSYKEHISFPQNIKTIFQYYNENGLKAASFVKSKNFFGDNSGANETGYSWNIHDILKWLEANDDCDYFLYLHYWNTHFPYFTKFSKEGWYDGVKKLITLLRHGSEKERKLVKELYRFSIERASEEFIYAIVEKLEKLKSLDDTLLVITSDHGESWGERLENIKDVDIFSMHGKFLYDEVIWTPLIMSGKVIPSGKEISTMTRSIDLFPTLLELNDLKVNTSAEYMEIDGKSLLPVIQGRESAERECFVSTAYLDKMQELVVNEVVQKFALRDQEWKIIYNKDKKTFEFYNVLKDPYERNNLVNIEANNFKRYKERINCYLKRVDFLQEEDSKRILTQRLKDLGYI